MLTLHTILYSGKQIVISCGFTARAKEYADKSCDELDINNKINENRYIRQLCLNSKYFIKMMGVLICL